MRTNIEIDDSLIAEAMKAANVTTKKAAVETALKRLVAGERQRQAIANLAGLGWEGDLDEMRRNDFRTFDD